MDTGTNDTQKRDRLFSLLEHAETLQHSRIYYLLVAETIFFLAAGTAIPYPRAIVVLSVAGLAIVLLFTITNIKQQIRASWIITELNKVDEGYKLYTNLENFKAIENIDAVTKWFSNLLLYESRDKKWFHCFFSTSFLYSWGLLIVIAFTWVPFLLYGILKSFPYFFKCIQ